jgi:hypothetical protein
LVAVNRLEWSGAGLGLRVAQVGDLDVLCGEPGQCRPFQRGQFVKSLPEGDARLQCRVLGLETLDLSDSWIHNSPGLSQDFEAPLELSGQVLVGAFADSAVVVFPRVEAGAGHPGLGREGLEVAVSAGREVTAQEAVHGNPIEAQFGPLRQFTIASSNHRNHTTQTRALHAYLRWRNANARHPDVLATQRRERARSRSEKGIRWGGRARTAA